MASVARKRLFTALSILMLSALFVERPDCAEAREWDAKDYRTVSDAPTLRRARSVFNGYLKQMRIAARVSSCSKVLIAHLGSAEDVYVGVCRLTSGARITVCGDTGVGQFGLSFIPAYRHYTPTDERLVSFAHEVCPGG